MRRISFSLLAFFLFFITGASVYASDPLAWRETRTEHCVFIFQEKDLEAVRELVGFCEEVYEKVGDFFDYHPQEVRSVVLGNVDIANGAFSSPPHHLELYVRSPVGPWHGSRGESWFRLLFIHELAHYFDMACDYGFFYVLSLVFGEGTRAGDAGFLPPWTYEGIAVLLETDFSHGGRGRNQFFLMHAKALLLDNAPFSLGHLEYGSAFPPPSRYYLFGYLFMEYLKRNYGPDVWRTIRKRFLEFPLFGPWGAIRAVTGRHQDELWEDMRKQWRQEFALSHTAGEGKAVSPPGFGDYYSPQNTAYGYFAYREKLDRPAAIVALDSETKSERVVVELNLYDERSFTASSGGAMLVYASITAGGSGIARYRADSDLYAVGLDKQLRVIRHDRLTTGAHLWQPALSPDGRRLIAVQGAGSYSRLVEVDLATGKTRVIFSRGGANLFNPVFSPDGTMIAFALNLRGRQDIYLLKTDDIRSGEAFDDTASADEVNAERARVLIGPDFAGDYFPRFVDNETILFTSDREGELALYAAGLDGKKLERVFGERIAAFDGFFDGDELVYGTFRSSGYCVRKTDREQLAPESIPLPQPEAPLPESPRPEISFEPFFDLPLFQFWIPWGGFQRYDGYYHFSIGVYLYWASLLETNGCDLSLLYFPTLIQPDIRFNFNSEAGPLNIYYTFRHAYGGGAGFYQERFSQFLNIELPLVDAGTPSYFAYLSLSFGLQHVYFIENSSGFAFLGNFSPTSLDDGNVLAVSGGLFFYHSKHDGPAAFYPPWTIINDFAGLAPLPVFPESQIGIVLLDRFSVTLPGLWNLSALKLGFKASYASDALGYYPYVVPRGLYPLVAQDYAGRLLAALDYLFTIAYTDAPLVGGLHIDGLGAGIHFEALADWDPFAPAFAINRYFYIGAELTLYAGLGKFSIPICLGVNLRFDWQFAESFDASDVGIYFCFSFDSFMSSLDERFPPQGRRGGNYPKPE